MATMKPVFLCLSRPSRLPCDMDISEFPITNTLSELELSDSFQLPDLFESKAGLAFFAFSWSVGGSTPPRAHLELFVGWSEVLGGFDLGLFEFIFRAG